jgi:hypothetical protein
VTPVHAQFGAETDQRDERMCNSPGAWWETAFSLRASKKVCHSERSEESSWIYAGVFRGANILLVSSLRSE